MKRVFSNSPDGPEPPARVFSETPPAEAEPSQPSAPRRGRGSPVFSRPPGEPEPSPIIRTGNTFISALTEKHRATVERLRSRSEKPPSPPAEAKKEEEDKD